jgi:hypothetical protein
VKSLLPIAIALLAAHQGFAQDSASHASLPAEIPALREIPAKFPSFEQVKVDWDSANAWSERTENRFKLSLNGLWQFQPAKTAGGKPKEPRDGQWAYLKLPGAWWMDHGGADLPFRIWGREATDWAKQSEGSMENVNGGLNNKKGLSKKLG